MADKRNRTPFYGAVPTSSLQADHVFMAGGESVQDALTKKFELIEEITLTEDTAIIERTTEPDLTPYNFSNLFVFMESGDTAANAAVRIIVDNVLRVSISGAIHASNYKSWGLLINFYGIIIPFGKSGNTDAAISSIYSTNNYLTTNITNLKLQAPTDNMPSGSIIKIYAVRA